MAIAIPMRCPFCAQENSEQALVCNSCARDITEPSSLIAERDVLIQKRDKMRDELARARAQIVTFRRVRSGWLAGHDEHEG